MEAKQERGGGGPRVGGAVGFTSGDRGLNSGVILSVNNSSLNGSARNGNGSNGTVGRKTDKRPLQLAVVGLSVTAVALILSITAICTSQWAASNVVVGEIKGPFMDCFRGYREVLECKVIKRNPLFAILSGICAISSTAFSLTSLLLSMCIVAMHHSETRVCLKFRKATLLRMIVTAIASLIGFMSWILFMIHLLQTGSYSMIWGFYMELFASILLCVAGSVAGTEWQKSRKLGGDPTGRNDPRGIHAHTISNPHFDEPSSPSNETKSPFPKRDLSPLEVHRNGDVAMTQISGQPYIMGVNGTNGHAKNGSSKKDKPSLQNQKKQTKRAILANRNAAMNSRPIVNKTANNTVILNRTRAGGAEASGTIVAFDPKRTPARSSMRKPKKQALQQSSAPDAASIEGSSSNPPDSPDGVVDASIPNPSFAQSSPQPKKKVRIHTQSTAV